MDKGTERLKTVNNEWKSFIDDLLCKNKLLLYFRDKVVHTLHVKQAIQLHFHSGYISKPIT